jgi:hypothetical protein
MNVTLSEPLEETSATLERFDTEQTGEGWDGTAVEDETVPWNIQEHSTHDSRRMRAARAPLIPAARPACSSRVQQPVMFLGALKKVFKKKEDPAVTAARASLSGMESLSGLSSMKLELEEGKAKRVAGPWKEYVKNDGRKWYYNTETSTQTWKKPEEFVTLDKVAEAAAAANAARGT